MQNTSMVSLDGGGLQAKSMTSQRYRAEPMTSQRATYKMAEYALLWQRYDNNKMAAICYYGNVMATTRWRLCVTTETLYRLNLL